MVISRFFSISYSLNWRRAPVPSCHTCCHGRRAWHHPPPDRWPKAGKVKPVLVKWLFMQKIDRMAQRARQFSPPQAL
jgi:hypothetical protein